MCPAYASRHSKAWFSNGLCSSCRRKYSLHKQLSLSPDQTNKSRYNLYDNKYNSLIKLARKKYFHDKLVSVCSDLTKTWSLIKEIISKKKPEQSFVSMRDNTGVYSDLTSKFNNFFANIGPPP